MAMTSIFALSAILFFGLTGPSFAESVSVEEQKERVGYLLLSTLFNLPGHETVPADKCSSRLTPSQREGLSWIPGGPYDAQACDIFPDGTVELVYGQIVHGKSALFHYWLLSQEGDVFYYGQEFNRASPRDILKLELFLTHRARRFEGDPLFRSVRYHVDNALSTLPNDSERDSLLKRMMCKIPELFPPQDPRICWGDWKGTPQ